MDIPVHPPWQPRGPFPPRRRQRCRFGAVNGVRDEMTQAAAPGGTGGQGEDIRAAGHGGLRAAVYAGYRSSPIGRDYSAPLDGGERK